MNAMQKANAKIDVVARLAVQLKVEARNEQRNIAAGRAPMQVARLASLRAIIAAANDAIDAEHARRMVAEI